MSEVIYEGESLPSPSTITPTAKVNRNESGFVITMPILPHTAKKILSRLQTTTASAVPPSLPTYQPSKSDVTLFDGLPEDEKRAAIAKLQQLASEQPGSTADKKSTRRRCFNWKTFAMVFLGLGFIAFATVASVALAVDNDKDPNLVAQLRMANTNLDRMKLLPDDSDWFFDFTKQDKYTFSPGGVVNANAATFPATVGQGMTMVSSMSFVPHLCFNENSDDK